MTVKEFFKTNAFKCIAVLLSIVLICCIALTICDSLFEVTDEERFLRAIAKIYGGNVTAEAVGTDDKQTEYDDATIEEVYYIPEDGNYLILVTGKGGYPSPAGTTSCYVVVEMENNAISGIGKVVISSYSSAQNLLASNINKDSVLGAFSDMYDGDAFTTQEWTGSGLVSGATQSLSSVVNAVNVCMEFVNTQILSGSAAQGGNA